MPQHRPTGKGICISALLSALLSNVALAQGSASGAPNANDAEFERLLKQGFELHQQARFIEAIPVFERARRLEPRDYFANLLLGIDLLRTGKATEALPRLELAAQIRTTEETPEDYLGEAQASLGHYAKAAASYQLAIERSHDSEEALEAWAGFALERFRQIGETLRTFEAGVATVRRLQAAAAKPESALTCADPIPALEQRLELPPADTVWNAGQVDAAYELSICYALEAGRAAERMQANPTDEAALHRLQGDALLRLKADATGAQVEYRRAIALRPGDPSLLERLAEAQLTAGDVEGARRSAEAALALDPHRRAAQRTMATLAMSSRDYEHALPWLRQLAQESPEDRSVQVELGQALAQTGKDAEALGHLGPALAVGYPDEKGALHALEARVLRALGREQEAAKASTEARRLSDAFQQRSENSTGGNNDVDH